MLTLSQRYLEAILRRYCTHYNDEQPAAEPEPTTAIMPR